MPSAPPLTWLRAFEAAARLGSFRDAAEELSVTASTISHQVRDLEGRIGVPLFRRSGRGLVLTREGEAYALPLRKGFDLIRNAVPGDASKRRLCIGAFPFVVNEVLVPNLRELRQRLGGVELSFDSEVHLPALSAVDPALRLDAIIRYGNGRFVGALARKIADVSLAPILALDAAPIADPAELLERGVIRVKSIFDGWGVWARGHGLECMPRNVVLETDSYYAATLAVARGAGVCLGILPFVRPWLARNRVKIACEFAVGVEEASYLVYAPYREHDPTIAALHDWLVETLR